MKKLLLLLFVVVSSSALCGAASDTNEENYQTMTELILANSPANVGTCSLTISSGDPASPKSYQLNIWPKELNLPLGFSLNSPKATAGRTLVMIDKTKNQMLYSESDLAGWVNVLLQLDSTNTRITGLKLYKSFPPYPNGEIYNTGTTCGTLTE